MKDKKYSGSILPLWFLGLMFTISASILLIIVFYNSVPTGLKFEYLFPIAMFLVGVLVLISTNKLANKEVGKK